MAETARPSETTDAEQQQQQQQQPEQRSGTASVASQHDQLDTGSTKDPATSQPGSVTNATAGATSVGEAGDDGQPASEKSLEKEQRSDTDNASHHSAAN